MGAVGAARVVAAGSSPATENGTVQVGVTPPAQALSPVRVKDLARLVADRGNQVMGLGLVVGLAGTGDSGGSLAAQMTSNLLEHFGLSVNSNQVRSRNVAAVMVTAVLPAYTRSGDTVDLTVSSIGDARSLQGGVLLQTPLYGADQQVYVVGQGPVLVGGFAAGGGGGSGSEQKNHPTVGRLPGGGIVERELPGGPGVVDGSASTGPVVLQWVLRQADFTTAQRVAAAIQEAVAGTVARAVDAATIQVQLPPEWTGRVVDFIAKVEGVPVVPDAQARVVINERTGTVVIGANVRIAPVAVAQGNLRIRIGPEQANIVSLPGAPVSSGAVQVTPSVSGPTDPSAASQTTGSPVGQAAGQVQAATITVPPGSVPAGGVAVVATGSPVQVSEEMGTLALVGGQQSLQDLVAALNAVGASPRDLIAIFQALKEAGALYGELVIE
ncbi:MAG: flagellar basal body P-ring protein FlgI [Limnochordaceae bacterium]|nr:flagellar basal body P-ring protein FlgI [Limnochordaceae bacterium]